MGPSAVAKIQIATDGAAGLWNAGVGPRVNLLIFDGPPEPLNKDAVPPGPFVIPLPPSHAFSMPCEAMVR
ncbi:MAG: hypothetical protein ACJAVR_002794 [Paracoccaceae bacterium]|jgi:hypothetical protein